MSDILLTEPVNFKLNIVEYEDVLGSFKAEISIENSIISLNFSCWFLYDIWGLFLHDDSVVESIDKDFKITINTNEIVFELSRHNNDDILFKYQKKIDNDIYLNIRDKFLDFPKWW